MALFTILEYLRFWTLLWNFCCHKEEFLAADLGTSQVSGPAPYRCFWWVPWSSCMVFGYGHELDDGYMEYTMGIGWWISKRIHIHIWFMVFGYLWVYDSRKFWNWMMGTLKSETIPIFILLIVVCGWDFPLNQSIVEMIKWCVAILNMQSFRDIYWDLSWFASSNNICV